MVHEERILVEKTSLKEDTSSNPMETGMVINSVHPRDSGTKRHSMKYFLHDRTETLSLQEFHLVN